MKPTPALLTALLLAPLAILRSAEPPKPADFKAKLQTTLNRHLNQLLSDDGSVAAMKGKTSEGNGALAFYLMFEITGEQKFRKAAVSLADQVLKDMRATKHGVLPIKEKDKPGGETIIGGGPPALGAYASGVAYILHKEGGRNDDLKYIATVLDRYPWNEEGWWASTIDVATGESKLPMTKPAIINKTAAIAMAAGIVSGYVREIDPELSARLKHKTDKCIYSQIIPAQEADGFWHYSLSDKDPKDKDVLGYFMLTTKELMDLQKFNPAYREEKLTAALQKAQAFALKYIAPMTDPNTGTATLGTRHSRHAKALRPQGGPETQLPTRPRPHRRRTHGRRNQDHERRARPLPHRQRRTRRCSCRGTIGTDSLGALTSGGFERPLAPSPAGRAFFEGESQSQAVTSERINRNYAAALYGIPRRGRPQLGTCRRNSSTVRLAVSATPRQSIVWPSTYETPSLACDSLCSLWPCSRRGKAERPPHHGRRPSRLRRGVHARRREDAEPRSAARARRPLSSAPTCSIPCAIRAAVA